MEKFNLNNLSSYDFELLSRDIMEKMLGLNSKLYTFSSGKDGEIDICSPEINNPKVMIQARHYIGSKFSDLKNKMNEEKKKVQKKNPKNYYLITSCKFSNSEQKKEIIKIIGKNFMKDISHIISYEDINRFLDDSKNIDILKKHYKLWFSSTSVFRLIQDRDILFDEEMFMSEIKEETQKFVKTDFYEKALKILNKENLVIITGNPGTGKSILSKMLILNYIKKGYKVKISNTNNISKIKQSLSSKEEKQLILLDDFLGQHYLELNIKTLKDVYLTIKYIKENYKNTKIILNSRITILNEAEEEENKFKDFMTKEKNKKILVDTTEISYLDKAKILYNHLYFSEMRNEFLEDIKRNKNYLKIITHKNYNPRIVEYMTISNRFNEPKKYAKEFLKNLENPIEIWKKQFEKMNEEDRIFLFTLYSLTNYNIEENVLKDVVNKRLATRNKDTTLNFFEKSLKKLIESLITIKLYDNKTLISVLNPSVNDFLKNELKNNLVECSDIIKNSIYIEQTLNILSLEEVRKSIEIKECIDELLETKKLLKLKTIDGKDAKSEFERFLSDDIYLEDFIQILNSLKINIESIDIKNIMLSHIENELEEKIEQYIEEEREEIWNFLDKIYNYNWNNKELQNILKNKEIQIYLENQKKEIILKIQNDLEKIIKDNKEIGELISDYNYKNIEILILDSQEECIKNIIEDINEAWGINISKDEIEESIVYCYNLFKEYSIKKNEIENVYYSNFENLKKIDQSHLEDIFNFSYEIFKKNQKNTISHEFLKDQFYNFDIVVEDMEYLKLIITEFNIIFEKKDRKKIEIDKFEKKANKIFKQDLENEKKEEKNEQEKEKIIELFEKKL